MGEDCVLYVCQSDKVNELCIGSISLIDVVMIDAFKILSQRIWAKQYRVMLGVMWLFSLHLSFDIIRRKSYNFRSL